MDLERIPGSIMAPACPIFTPLIIQHVSNAALKHVAKQYKLAVSDQYKPECSGAFEQIMGLPCCHTIKGLLDHACSKFLELRDFDPHWFYDAPSLEELWYEADDNPVHRILEPAVIKHRRAFQNRNIRIAEDENSRIPCLWEAQQVREEAQRQAALRARIHANNEACQTAGHHPPQVASRLPLNSPPNPLPTTPLRSPAVSIDNFVDALEEQIEISPLPQRQPLTELDVQQPSCPASTPQVGEATEWSTPQTRRVMKPRACRGRPAGGEGRIIQDFNKVTDGGVFEAFRL
jgi:hypothetical protein